MQASTETWLNRAGSVVAIAVAVGTAILGLGSLRERVIDVQERVHSLETRADAAVSTQADLSRRASVLEEEVKQDQSQIGQLQQQLADLSKTLRTENEREKKCVQLAEEVNSGVRPEITAFLSHEI